MLPPRTLLLALLPPVCWGAGFTLAKPAAQHFPPLFMMLLIYGFIALATSLTSRTAIKTPWRHVVIISAFAVTIQGALALWGLKTLNAATANLLLQAQVPAAVFMGWLLAGEALNARKLIGTLIALLGVVIVIGLPAEKPPLLPTLAVIASGVFWAMGQVLTRMHGRDDGLTMLRANALAGTPQLILATLLLERGQWQSLTSANVVQWAALAFVAIFGFYLAYQAWFSLLRRVRVDEAMPFILLMTPIGIATAALVLGEEISRVQVMGGLILLFGLAVVYDVVRLPFARRV
jgi:O-acetylserine/cysteine efflux transporter